MGIISSLNSALDLFLRPLIENLGNFWALALISFGIALFMTLVYKWTTNQSLMKDLKDEMNAFQKELRELKNNPEKMMEVQKKAMETNMKYMMHSMKSTLFTFIPLLLIFAWLNSNLAYESIHPGEYFTTIVEFENTASGIMTIKPSTGIEVSSEKSLDIKDGNAIWKLRADKEGTYNIDFDYDKKIYNTEVIVTTDQKYNGPIKSINDGKIKTITVSNQPLKFNFRLFNLSWLWTYLIFSIIFSMVFRKVLKVY